MSKISLFIPRTERAYIFTFRYFLYAPVILEMMMRSHRLCALIDRVGRKKNEKRKGRNEGRGKENDRHFVLYIFSGHFTSDYFHILYTRDFALLDRSIGTPRRRNISFTEVCAKRESSFNKFLGGWILHA